MTYVTSKYGSNGNNGKKKRKKRQQPQQPAPAPAPQPAPAPAPQPAPAPAPQPAPAPAPQPAPAPAPQPDRLNDIMDFLTRMKKEHSDEMKDLKRELAETKKEVAETKKELATTKGNNVGAMTPDEVEEYTKNSDEILKYSEMQKALKEKARKRAEVESKLYP